MKSTDRMRIAHEDARSDSLPQAVAVDRQIAELGATTVAHGHWMSDTVSNLQQLYEAIHRLRREERYFHSMTEALMPALPLVKFHANGLSRAVYRCYARLRKGQATGPVPNDKVSPDSSC